MTHSNGGFMANILIVDDDRYVLDSLAGVIESWNYNTFKANSGQEALDIFKKTDIDLVLSDIVMPGMNGIEFMKKINDLDSQCLFIFLTGHPSMDTAVEALQAGAEDYLVKPVNFDELGLKINRSLSRRKNVNRLPFMQGLNWALLISIPFWLILGLLLAKMLF